MHLDGAPHCVATGVLNFRTGYPQMGTLVCDWLAATEGYVQSGEGQTAGTAAAGVDTELSASHFLRVLAPPA